MSGASSTRDVSEVLTFFSDWGEEVDWQAGVLGGRGKGFLGAFLPVVPRTILWSGRPEELI